MSKLKSDIDRMMRNKIEAIADILDNPTLTPATKVLQLVHDCDIDRSVANKLVNAGGRLPPQYSVGIKLPSHNDGEPRCRECGHVNCHHGEVVIGM